MNRSATDLNHLRTNPSKNIFSLIVGIYIYIYIYSRESLRNF